MITGRADLDNAEAQSRAHASEAAHERWAHWPVNWTAVWVGALAAVTAALIFGLIGIALGAHLLGPEHRVVDIKKLGFGALVFSVLGAFISFVIGGWATGKIAGILRSEPAMVHGAITWLVAVPLIVALAAMGAANYFGGWYGGLGATPSGAAAMPFDRPFAPDANATAEERASYQKDLAQYQTRVNQWREDTPKAARNSALGAVTALLLGLVGSVVGGWLACGEPMNFSHHRTRQPYRSSVSS